MRGSILISNLTVGREPLARPRCFASRPPSPTRGEGKAAPPRRVSAPKLLRRPCIQAAGNGLLVTTPLRRNVQTDDLGIREQFREIGAFEKQSGLGMHRI